MFFLSSGTSDPRAIAQPGRSLPGAREISVIVHTPSNVGDKDPDISYMIMLFIISAKFTHYAKNCPKIIHIDEISNHKVVFEQYNLKA